jgi:hypothetical protein
LFAFLISGCGKNIPKADDKDVTNLVLEICEEEMQQQLFVIYGAKHFSMMGNPTYKDNVNSSDETMQKVISQVDEAIENIQMNLRGIRTIDINEDVGKIRCAAELVLSNDRKLDIEYTAQYTEDNLVYVEVFGL